MQIRSLKLINFRNYLSLNITFSDNLNIIYGNNGMGKTNLVEAIYVLALTKSFRTNNDKILISKEKDLFKIEGIINDFSENKFQVILNKEGKKAKINQTFLSKLSDYISKFSVIVFSPDDLHIIKTSPNERRKTLNRELSQLNNCYLKDLNKYNKILKQRNSYLKTMYINHNTSGEFLDILTNELITYGEKINKARNNYFFNINEKINANYFKIAKEKAIEIKYISDFNNFDREKLKKKYKSQQNKDTILGQTSIGIHHDDYIFQLKGEALKDYGSEGQQKNAIIAYKLAELELFYKEKGSYPVLILDDLFSELDKTKIKNILRMIKTKIQTFITTTDTKIISREIIMQSKLLKVNKGSVKEVKNISREII